ncbi:MAG: hypothetical protein L0Y56_09015, partial [Nitrospira sp.]|nr:hypothetical protein [Nitrospira sp.]
MSITPNLYPDLQPLLIGCPLNVYVGDSLILNDDYYIGSISIPYIIQGDEKLQVEQRTLSVINIKLVEQLNPSILEFWWSLEQDNPDEPYLEIESKSIVFTDLDTHQAYEILSVGNLYKTCCEPPKIE